MMNNNITCGNCKLYNKYRTVNNCKANIIGTVNPEDMGCYKIQFNKINE